MRRDRTCSQSAVQQTASACRNRPFGWLPSGVATIPFVLVVPHIGRAQWRRSASSVAPGFLFAWTIASVTPAPWRLAGARPGRAEAGQRAGVAPRPRVRVVARLFGVRGRVCPKAAVRAVPASLLLLCLLLRSSWLTADGGRQVSAARVPHRRGGRAAVAVSVGAASGVPEHKRSSVLWRPLLLRLAMQQPAAG